MKKDIEDKRVVSEWQRSIVRHMCNVKMRQQPRPFIDRRNPLTTHKLEVK